MVFQKKTNKGKVKGKKEIEKKKSTLAPREMSTKVFEIMDRRDEAQIMEALKGNVSEIMCYFFKSGSQEITGISSPGADELARQTEGVLVDPRTPPNIIYEDDWKVRVAVYALDPVTKTGGWGTAEQQKRIRLRSGGMMPDDKYFNKAVTKAQRNAILKRIPLAIKKRAIEEWKKLGKAKQITEAEVVNENPTEGNVPEVEL